MLERRRVRRRERRVGPDDREEIHDSAAGGAEGDVAVRIRADAAGAGGSSGGRVIIFSFVFTIKKQPVP